MLSGPLSRAAPELQIERCYSMDRDSKSSGQGRLHGGPAGLRDQSRDSDQSVSKITPASFEVRSIEDFGGAN